MVRSTRTVPLLVALLVVAVSCGGDGSVFDASTTTAPPEGADLVDADALAVGEAVVDRLGPEPGMLAVGYGLDRGYTAGQIAGAATSGTLRADGTITGVEPELPLWGIFADLPEIGASGGGGERAAQTLAYADEIGQVTATDWTRGLAGEFDAHVSGQPASSLDEADQNMATVMIALILGLSDAGYSADQIILGIAADEWVLGFIPREDLGPTLCWHLRDADGYFVRPARTPTGSFPSTAACRGVLEQLAPPDTGSTTTTSTTTTTVAEVDPDGITNGIYTGDVRLAAEVGAPVYELSDTIVELEVTDDVVRATVEFTARVSVRVSGVDPVCIATTTRLYFGQGLPAEPLDVLMEPQLQEILSLEGPECGVVEGSWATTAEADLLAEFAEERAFSLIGSFSNGTFEGTIAEVLAVTAAITD